jgi:hypothetical protein
VSLITDIVDKLKGEKENPWATRSYGGAVLPVPPGYPEYLPKPVLRDGGLYLDPYPAMPDKSLSQIPDRDIAWVMVALQPYVMQYADRPYDVNWVIDGWGSGKVHVGVALNGRFGGTLKLDKPMPPENFLVPPKEPTGFDKFLISLGANIGTLMGNLFNSVLPGSGMLVKKLIDRETWSPPSMPVDTSGVYGEVNADSGGAAGNKNNLLLWGGALLLAGAAYLYYEGDL